MRVIVARIKNFTVDKHVNTGCLREKEAPHSGRLIVWFRKLCALFLYFTCTMLVWAAFLLRITAMYCPAGRFSNSASL